LAPSSSVNALARSPKPPNHALKASKNSARSEKQSIAEDPLQHPESMLEPRADHPRREPRGLHEHLGIPRPSMKLSAAFGASEEVEGIARRRRVEHEDIPLAGPWSSNSFSIAMYSWLPARAFESWR